MSSKLSQLMPLVASPIRNTEYSSRLSGPPRAPTIRSAPEIVFANPARASVRILSTPTSSATLTATDKTVSPAVNRRLRTLLTASSTKTVRMATLPSRPSPR